jgi:hypothetical protein
MAGWLNLLADKTTNDGQEGVLADEITRMGCWMRLRNKIYMLDGNYMVDNFI